MAITELQSDYGKNKTLEDSTKEKQCRYQIEWDYQATGNKSAVG